jgi:NAD-dependent SIR2 family protein deacetylase
MSEASHTVTVRLAAEAILGSDALVIAAGAGMGVDSGLPDFRGPEGFWNAYPAYRHLGLGFMDLANPVWFENDPALAWGFYGHRLELYRATPPHRGFELLRGWAQRMSARAFVFTSNVDGHFRAAGFEPDRIVECHGSLEWMQCLESCGAPLFPSDAVTVHVDPTTFRAMGTLPACPSCGGLARPNVLMFGDWGWDTRRTAGQEARMETWLRGRHRDGARTVVVECGAGTAVPTVRAFSERLLRGLDATLIRINLRESHGPKGVLALARGAREALEAIDDQIARITDTDSPRGRT